MKKRSERSTFHPEKCSKVALTLGYFGTKYYGSLYNPDLPTIEGDLRKSFEILGASSWGKVIKDKYEWSAMSRTDRGVHACRLVVSMLLLTDSLLSQSDGQCLVPAIGSHLPEFVSALNVCLQSLNSDIIIWDAIIPPRRFDARSSCSFREYKYILPISLLVRDTRNTIEESMRRLQLACNCIRGVHSYHNFVKVSKVTNLRQYVKQNWKSLPFTKNPIRRKAFPWETRDTGWLSEGESDIDEIGENNNVLVRFKVEPPQHSDEKLTGYTAFEEWPLRIVRETLTEIYECSVHPLESSTDYFVVSICGSSFAYNQIRYMIGAALAVGRSEIPLNFLKAALELPVAFRFPKAPSFGLVLISGGFSHVELEDGLLSMDCQQNIQCNGRYYHKYGHYLTSMDSDSARSYFDVQLCPHILECWRQELNKEVEDWRWSTCAINFSEKVAQDINALLLSNSSCEEGTYGLDKLQREAVRTRERIEFVRAQQALLVLDPEARVDILQNNKIWPSQLAVHVAVRFALRPGRRMKNILLGLSSRILRGDLPSALNVSELLQVIEDISVDKLETEGYESEYNLLKL